MSHEIKLPADWGKSNRSALIEIIEIPDGAEFQILLRNDLGLPVPASHFPEKVLEDHAILLLLADRMLANTNAVAMTEND